MNESDNKKTPQEKFVEICDRLARYDEMLDVLPDKGSERSIIFHSFDLNQDFKVDINDINSIYDAIDEVFTSRDVYITKVISITNELDQCDDIESAIQIDADADIVEEIEQCLAEWFVRYITGIQKNIAFHVEVIIGQPGFIKLKTEAVGDSIELPVGKIISAFPQIQDVIESCDLFFDSLNKLLYNTECIKPLPKENMM